jgi:hypothetical protein
MPLDESSMAGLCTNRAGHGEEGVELAAALDDSAVAGTAERVGLGGCDGGLAEHTLEVWVALTGFAAASAGPGLGCAGRELGSGDQVLSLGSGRDGTQLRTVCSRTRDSPEYGQSTRLRLRATRGG